MLEVIDLNDPHLLEEFDQERVATPLFIASRFKKVQYDGKDYETEVCLVRPYSNLECCPIPEVSDNSEFQRPQGLHQVTSESIKQQMLRARYPELADNASGYLLEYEEGEKVDRLVFAVSTLPSHVLIMGALVDGGMDEEKVKKISWDGLECSIDDRQAQVNLRANYCIRNWRGSHISELESYYQSFALRLQEDVEFALKTRERLRVIAKVADAAVLPMIKRLLASRLRVVGLYTNKFSFQFRASKIGFTRNTFYDLHLPSED